MEYMDLTQTDIARLRDLKTWDESERHFTETHPLEWLGRMEVKGYIVVDRPKLPGQRDGSIESIGEDLKAWTVELTDLGKSVTEG